MPFLNLTKVLQVQKPPQTAKHHSPIKKKQKNKNTKKHDYVSLEYAIWEIEE